MILTTLAKMRKGIPAEDREVVEFFLDKILKIPHNMLAPDKHRSGWAYRLLCYPDHYSLNVWYPVVKHAWKLDKYDTRDLLGRDIACDMDSYDFGTGVYNVAWYFTLGSKNEHH